ncbi:MAG: L-seryl-tRNA(Sec) selenium transferase [Longilinea sp.]|nr:L-seryl-tRNA(Sec) selenium transferase [Longilinea sp.]MCA1953998.1 L-seryl-tRNA(Sec) selenium transferase [Anaerolinea sp.]
MNDLRRLPAIDTLLQTPAAQALCATFGRPLTLNALRQALQQQRRAEQDDPHFADPQTLLSSAQALLQTWCQPSLLPVINASGVVLHTNLGRAPLSTAASLAIQQTAATYNNLEFDLESGRRGHREQHIEALLTQLTGAEAALVVNNNAAAVLLTLSALARRQRVIIARGQLVEIGGGFRIPDVMAQSGAKLIEIGTTNRTHAQDYVEALQAPTALVLHVHSSNFRIIGFASQPNLAEITHLAHEHNVPVMADLGSGCLLETNAFGLAHEPMVQEAISQGVDLVCFSGDKLLGGPQAGIIVGKRDLLAKIRKHPLLRAVRADKLCLAALQATLLHYRKDEALSHIPIWRMIATPLATLQARATAWQAALDWGEVLPGHSTIGGGSLPEETLPTALLSLSLRQPNRWLSWLRTRRPAIIARIQNDRIVFDPRTVLPEQEGNLLQALTELRQLNNSPKGSQ